MRHTIVFSDSFQTFLYSNRSAKNRIASLLWKTYTKEMNQYRDYYRHVGTVYNHRYINGFKSSVLTDKDINYITFRNDGTISYLPQGKEHKVTADGKWSKEGRQNGRPSKVIRKLFHPRAIKLLGLKDSDFEAFCNSYKSAFNDNGLRLELLPRTKIKSVYNADLQSSNGSLGGSCMNGDSGYMDIYSKCKQLSILILWDKDGMLCGRSLVWKINEEITLMDRIYVTSDFMYDSFIDYASENNLWRKENYKSYEKRETFIKPDGEMEYRTFRIDTDTDFDQYPYIDTFAFGGDGYLTNSPDNTRYEYTDIGGERSDIDPSENGIWDDLTDEWIDEEYASQIDCGDYAGHWTHCDNVICIDGQYWYREDNNIYYLSSRGRWYEVDELISIDDEYHHPDDTVYTDDNGWILKTDAVEVVGKWYHKDETPDTDETETDSKVIVEKLLKQPAKSNDPDQQTFTFDGIQYPTTF